MTAIIPAAGESARLGQPKQLVKLKGEALVHRAARISLEAGCARVVVVEGAVPLRDVLSDLAVEVVTCPSWRLGPGASLREGAGVVGEVAMLVVLADQHAVSAEQLRELISAPGEVAAALYAGALGVPARFSAKYSGVLRSLQDSQGAKGWLRAHSELVTAVEMPAAEFDLDTPGQLDRLGR
ncbi:MAG: NTP transferase domain-containing protein [Archangium sp.]|nr:NTP transferase domain-containing protein [Archangium sp.]